MWALQALQDRCRVTFTTGSPFDAVHYNAIYGTMAALPILEEVRSDGPIDLLTVRYDHLLPEDASRWEDVIDPSTAPDELEPWQ